MGKNFKEPRAVLAMSQPLEFERMVQALAQVGIAGYLARELDWAPGMAVRNDTLLEVLDMRGVPLERAIAMLKEIRSHRDSESVLVAVLLAPSMLERRKALLDAGANVVEEQPLSLAKAFRLLLGLARPPRLSGPAEAAELTQSEAPWQVLNRQITRHLGHHKIFIGAAPGVGKTYAMLLEAHDLARRGRDVVVGIVETHGRQETAQMLEGLIQVPRRQIAYKGATLEEMDLESLLERRPQVVLVDELAHTNAPGSLNEKRYEDVQILLAAGIPVTSTLNVQHIESLNNIVERITGVKVRETVPDTVLEEADELVLVDISPESLQERLKAGKIYARDKVTQSLNNFFTTHNLTALRELVLRELADKVDERLEAVRADVGREGDAARLQERILVCLSPTLDSQRLIRRGARLAERLNADLVVLSVATEAWSARELKAIEQNVHLAETLQARIVTLQAPDVAGTIARYATEHQVTMIVLGESGRSPLLSLFRRPILETILKLTRRIDVVIVATQGQD